MRIKSMDINNETQIAKIDFIVCDFTGSWFNESHNIPRNIAIKSSEEIVNWVKVNGLIDDSYYYVGVYWRDPNIISLN